MRSRRPNLVTALLTALLLAGQTGGLEAKSYSSGGGHSYSSSSSHSSSSGGSHSFSGSSRSSGGAGHSSGSSSGSSKSSTGSSSRSAGSQKSPGKGFTSSSGKSYGSGSSWSDDNRRGYNSSKSYTAPSGASASPRSGKEAASPSALTFDTAAARARKEETSQQEFSRFKEANAPKLPANDSAAPGKAAPSYRVTPPPLTPSASGQYRRPDYIPDAPTIWSRPARSYTIFAPYVSRPVVVYRDPYNSFFWWWLLDRSLDDRAYWAYHHRYDMDPARYQALLADNRQLEQRVAELEAQQVPRDPAYTPPGVDRDLMYSDQHVKRSYSNRPTASGRVVFWFLAIPVAIGACWFLIWFIFYKRWQPAT